MIMLEIFVLVAALVSTVHAGNNTLISSKLYMIYTVFISINK